MLRGVEEEKTKWTVNKSISFLFLSAESEIGEFFTKLVGVRCR